MLGRGRAKRGIFEGDLEEGELEIGQIISFIKDKGIQTVQAVMDELLAEYEQTRQRLR